MGGVEFLSHSLATFFFFFAFRGLYIHTFSLSLSYFLSLLFSTSIYPTEHSDGRSPLLGGLVERKKKDKKRD